MATFQDIQVNVRLRSLFTALGLLMTVTAGAQTRQWQLIHQGNKAFANKAYQTAGSYYNKALKLDANDNRALYNLGNVNLALHEDSIALSLYDKVAASEKDARLRSMANHNKGVVYQLRAGEAQNASEKQQNLLSAIDAYKQALRDNPESQDSRYNLVLCQKQLKKNNDKDKDNKDKDKDKQKQPQQQPQQQPLMNYARQAEQQTRRKLNASQRQRQLDKNW